MSMQPSRQRTYTQRVPANTMVIMEWRPLYAR